MGRHERAEAEAIVESSPIENVHVGAYLWTFDGGGGPGERVKGLRRAGRLVALVQSCRGVSWAMRPELRADPELPLAVARHIASIAQGEEVFFGPEPEARRVLDALRPRGLYPTELRHQEMMAAPELFGARLPRVDGAFRLRPARPDDLAWLLATHSAMCLEDLGIDQVARHRAGYERYFRMLVDERRVYVGELEGVRVFKAETPIESVGARMIEGVYTDPEARGRGLASYAMARLQRRAARDGLRACLYVHKRNEGARRLYRNLGFRVVCPWLTVLVGAERGRPAEI